MGTEELKVVLEMINGVKDGAVSITIVYLLLTSLVPLLKYSIVFLWVTLRASFRADSTALVPVGPGNMIL